MKNTSIKFSPRTEKMSILVIGGAGFIGSHTVDRLLALGHHVRVLDNLSKPVHKKRRKPDYLPSQVEFIEGDIRDKKTLQRALVDIEAVYHFAAYQDNLFDYSTYFDVNATGTALLYEVIKEDQLNIKKVIVASSQAVIGEGEYHCQNHGSIFPKMRLFRELAQGNWEVSCPRCKGKITLIPSAEKVAHPQSQYSMSKYAQEMIALNLGKQLDIPSVALRYSIVQGARQSFYNPYSGACRQFCLSLFLGEPPEIFEDGQQIRDFINIEDVVAANIIVLHDKRADHQVFNVGGERGYKLLDFYEIVHQQFHSNLKPRILGNFRLGDTRHALSNISKLKLLGWHPQHTPIKSIRDYQTWLKSQPAISKRLLRRHHQVRSTVVCHKS